MPKYNLFLPLHYVTHQVDGLEDWLQGQEIEGSLSPLVIDILLLMWMVVHHSGRYILIPTTTEQPLVEGEDVDE